VTQIPDEPSPNLSHQGVADQHRDLIARIATDRDRVAFESLFLYFGPRIKALMLRAGSDHALAEDLVQDVMTTVWRKVDLYAPERGTVSAWVFTIARNARIDRLRRGSSRPYEDVEAIEIAAEDPDAEEAVLANQRAELVAEALAELPENQRRIIEMAYVDEIPQTQIAEMLLLPLGTVKSRMRLAYAKLRSKLEEIS
jgi:RNA polymerase sigma-70 factor (ECF subfamily)